MGRRKRAYRFENDIDKRYRDSGCRSWRLGSAAATLPDVMAVGPDAIHVHELKTTIGELVRIPAKQIERCLDVVESFPKYRGVVVLSARFGHRAEYHFIWNVGAVENVSINVHGKTRGGSLTPISWDDLVARLVRGDTHGQPR